MRKNFSIHNNSKLPKHKKQEYSLDLRKLVSSKIIVNESSFSTKKNNETFENPKFSPLDTCKHIENREKLINVLKKPK